MVAMVGNRALDDPGAFGVEHNDALAVRDLGWQLVWVDNAQEALDTALIAYKVAEDRRVFLPCAISCDGAFLTHSQAIVKIPSQEKVDQFLPRYDRGDLLLHPDNPITVAGLKAVAIIDGGFSPGAPHSGGLRGTEVGAALYRLANRPPLLALICGLGGREVTLPDVKNMTDKIYAAAAGKPQPSTQWIGLRE